MTAVDRAAWTEANQRYLMARVDVVREYVARPATQPASSNDEAVRRAESLAEQARRAMPASAALDVLCDLFSLSSFERDVLLLCAAVELDGSFATSSPPEQGRGRPPVTFSLALAALPHSHWSAVTPAGPLRYWSLIHISSTDSLTTSPLTIDERVLHFLTGLSHIDDRLRGLLTYQPPTVDLPPSQLAIARRLTALWSAEWPDGPPIVHIGGSDADAARGVAAAACRQVGLDLQMMSASAVPMNPIDRDQLLRLLERELMLTRCALLVHGDEGELPEAVATFIEHAQCRLLLSRCKPPTRRSDRVVKLEVKKPTRDEQHRLWRHTLGPAAADVNGRLDLVVSQFDLTPAAIAAAAAQMRAHAGDDPLTTGERLWEACRAVARGPLDDLAQRIETLATWEDLVLPAAQLFTLRDVAAHVRQRRQVFDEWGLASKSTRGLGISALFAGPSGTGKTMAAEVLAADLGLDLYRIDLSQIVNKYIGETEKNLRRVFDAADAGGTVLLFDEADALFGKRSEVKDSHDRYANIEVSYLLQRMESYRGLAILTTNLKTALDDAFLRRLRFIVHFPFPDAMHRAEMWRRVYPPRTPVGELDFTRLARLNVAGGHIRNIAVHAAFFAAEAAEPIGMSHLLRAARCEYTKLERQLTDAEVAGWG